VQETKPADNESEDLVDTHAVEVLTIPESETQEAESEKPYKAPQMQLQTPSITPSIKSKSKSKSSSNSTYIEA
jgi:hypothetical protein